MQQAFVVASHSYAPPGAQAAQYDPMGQVVGEQLVPPDPVVTPLASQSVPLQ